MSQIIIADDHPLMLKGTSDFVISLGHKVLGIYTNGIEAYNNILIKFPDLAILDISMPGMDGLEIAKQLGVSKSKTKIILLTMHKELSFFKEAQQHGVKGYLLKDFALEELAICIENVSKGDN